MRASNQYSKISYIINFLLELNDSQQTNNASRATAFKSDDK